MLLDSIVNFRLYTENVLKIGEVARRSGVGIEALRFYETRKLIEPDARTESGYRLYDPERIFERLSFIKKAQSIGFSLDEIARLIDEAEHGKRPCAEVRRLARAKLQALEERVAELERFRDELRETVEAWDAKGEAAGQVCGLIESLAPKATQPANGKQRRKK